MAQEPHWLVRFDQRTNQWVIDLSCGADRICLPGGHPTQSDALRQAQMLMSASGVSIINRN